MMMMMMMMLLLLLLCLLSCLALQFSRLFIQDCGSNLLFDYNYICIIMSTYSLKFGVHVQENSVLCLSNTHLVKHATKMSLKLVLPLGGFSFIATLLQISK